MNYKDYYKIMGLQRDASQEEIKRAYRKMARKYHPDISKTADASERFKEVNEAYEVLKDPKKRAAYDQLGSGWQSGQEFRPPPNWGRGFEFGAGDFSPDMSSGFSDFFETLFGRRAARRSSSRPSFSVRGEDQYATVTIGIEDAYHGTTQLLTLRKTGGSEGGQIQSRTHRLNVKIPKGLVQGQRIRLGGQGGSGIGGAPAGDLYLEVKFRPHLFYRTQEKDLYLDLPLAPWEAALGATVNVPTPEGTVQLHIPENVHQGKTLRLKGRGIPAKEKGDFFVVINIALPAAENDRAKAFYRQMAKELPFNPRAHLGV
ncbi:MAG: DnaJ C-terminal domain-containing protein [Nitrospiria bacterium]